METKHKMRSRIAVGLILLFLVTLALAGVVVKQAILLERERALRASAISGLVQDGLMSYVALLRHENLAPRVRNLYERRLFGLVFISWSHTKPFRSNSAPLGLSKTIKALDLNAAYAKASVRGLGAGDLEDPLGVAELVGIPADRVDLAWNGMVVPLEWVESDTVYKSEAKIFAAWWKELTLNNRQRENR